MLRDKLFVEFPLAKTINEAIEFMKAGGSVWQEDSNDFPSCCGFDSIDDLKDNFPEEDWDYNADEQDLFLHLVPEGEENSKATPFKKGETVWATEEIVVDTNDGTTIHTGFTHEVMEVHVAGDHIRLTRFPDMLFPVDKFCRCCLPVRKKRVYVCSNFTTSSMGPEPFGVYEDLNFLKEECAAEFEFDVLWSDEYEDRELLEDEMEKLGILNDYSGGNWDIEAICKKTGSVVMGVMEDFLWRQSS